MSIDPRALVEKAITHTRNNALQQLGIGVVGSAAMPIVWGGFPTFVIVLLAVNALITFVLARRWLRLRHGSAAVVALLDTPADVKEIASWPRKLPPNRMPVFLDVTTHGGATCSLLLEPKKPQAVADLLGALQRRSPDAMLLIPKLPVA